MAAFNACITVGYVAGAALKGITLDKLEIRTTRQARPARLPRPQRQRRRRATKRSTMKSRSRATALPSSSRRSTRHVMKTSPNYFNLSRPIRMNGILRLIEPKKLNDETHADPRWRFAVTSDAEQMTRVVQLP